MDKSFPPSLFKGRHCKVLSQGITCLPFKQSGQAIPNPNLSSWENWVAPFVVMVHLISALFGRKNFKTGDHSMLLRKVQGDIRRRRVQDAQTAMEEVMTAAPTLDAYQLIWRTWMGAWLIVLVSTVNWTELGAQECRNVLFLHSRPSKTVWWIQLQIFHMSLPGF